MRRVLLACLEEEPGISFAGSKCNTERSFAMTASLIGNPTTGSPFKERVSLRGNVPIGGHSHRCEL